MYKHRLIKGTVCSILIISIICLSLFTGVALSVSTEKLSDYLVETLATMRSNDKLEVTIFFKDMDDSSLRERVIDKYGKDINVYENESRFYSEVVPNIKVNNKPIKSVMSVSEINATNFSFDNEKSTLDLELRKEINKEVTNEMNEYLSERREVRSDMVKDYLKGFKTLFNEDDIVFCSEHIEMMRVNLSKAEILTLSNNPYIESVYYSKSGGGNESWHIPELIEADSYSGTGSINYNDGDGYDGTGITIGIIEHEGGRYDNNAYSLTDAIDSLRLHFLTTPGVSNAVNSNHATTVTSIICGDKVTVKGHTYEGLANGAIVYQTAIKTDTDFYSAMEMLINNGVNVVTFSARVLSINTAYYSEYDKAVDKYVADNKIVFVKSAGNSAGSNPGNNGYVTSPGKAYNSITVGNVSTKASNNQLNSPFNISSSSSYVERPYLPNKPDVVAPGSNIHIPISDSDEEDMRSGTSYSAPVVAGLAAQLMQRGAVYLSNPNLVKNIIMNGASNDKIYESTVSYGELLEKSGAGLVNAVNSFAAKDNKYFGVFLYNNTNTDYQTIEDVYIQEGQTIKIVLTYLKEENIDITEEYGNNLDLRLAQTAGYTIHAVSESTNNNVEIIEFEATSSGTYNIQVRMLESILTANGNNDLHYCVTWRIY